MAGFGALQTAFAVFLVVLLAAMSVIDLRQRRIPDAANLLLFSGAMLYWVIEHPAAIPLQVAASVGAFGFLFVVRKIHMKLTSRTGLGMGDVKMAGASAAWFHPVLLPMFILVAAGTAIIALVIRAGGDRALMTAYRLPFAPFLSIGLLVAWLTELRA